MARIPSAPDLGQRPQATPQAGGIALDPSVAAADATAARRVGEVGMDVGADMLRQQRIEQEKETERVNRLRAEDATNQLLNTEQDLSIGESGFGRLEGANAATRPIVTEYSTQFADKRRAIESTLVNDQQRELFARRADLVQRQFGGKLLAHVTKQSDVYEKQVVSGAEASMLTVAGNNYASDGENDAAFMRSATLRRLRGEREGEPTEMIDAAIAGMRDKQIASRLTAWQTADPVGAYTAFQRFANDLSPAARLHMKQQLAGAALPAIAAQEVDRGGPAVQRVAPAPDAPIPGPMTPSAAVEKFGPIIDQNATQYGVDPGVMRRQLQAESGGNPSAVNRADAAKTGSPSIGIAQFQPATAKRYGIDPKDPQQAIQAQAAYMSDLLKMFDGDYQKALAGYNWGEGNVQKAVAQHGDGWMAHAPKSTQAYVQKIVATEQRGGVDDLRTTNFDASTFGKREDGTPKGTGFLGVLKTPGGGVATEYTVGVQINGKQMDIPTLVPTLSRAEVQQVLKAAGDRTGKTDIPDAIVEKAADFARSRIAAGKSVFAEPGESPSERAPPANRSTDYASMTPGQLLAVKTGNPVIDAMPADDKLRTLGLMQNEAIRQRQQKQALLGTREADATAAYYVNGTTTNAPTTGEFVDAYGPVEGMKRARRLDEARQTGQTIQQMSTLPTPEIQRVLAQKPAQGEGFAERQKAYELKVSAAQRIVSARQSDPVGYALSTKAYGIKAITPEMLQPAQLPAFADELRKRAAAAPKMASDYGTVPALLTKGEGQALAGMLKTSPSEMTKQYLAAIYGGLGDINAYKAVMGAIAPDAPVIAEAGIMQARQARSTGRPGSGPDSQALPVRDVAGMVLDGYRLMNPNPKADGKEHEGGKGLVRMPSGDQEKLMRDDFDKAVGGAFTNSPQARDIAWQTARAIYAKKTQEDNDQTGNNNSDRWKSAIDLATGGVYEHNGQKIVPPYGWSLDSFRDGLKAKATQIAPTTKLTANEIMALPLRNVGDGEYEVLVGSGVLRDKNGAKVLLELGETPPAPAPTVIPAGKLGASDFSVTRGGAVTGMRKR